MLRTFTHNVGKHRPHLQASNPKWRWGWRYWDGPFTQPTITTFHTTLKETATGKRWSSSMGNLGVQRELESLSTKPTKRGFRSPRPEISTLDPSKFTLQDIVDISGPATQRPTLRFAGAPATSVLITYKTYGCPNRYVPFPPNTKGILYFQDRSSVHPLAGDIRFRVLPVQNGTQMWSAIDIAELFARGHDLIGEDGLGPWHIPFLSILRRRDDSLLKVVQTHGYATEVERARRFLSSIEAKRRLHSGSQIVDSITDPFILDLMKGNSITFLQKEGVGAWRLLSGFTTRYSKEPIPEHPTPGYICSGTVLARFEMVMEPTRCTKTPAKQVVLRVLKFLKPPVPGSKVVQEEGQLLKRYDLSNNTELRWKRESPLHFMTPSSVALLEETYLPSAA